MTEPSDPSPAMAELLDRQRTRDTLARYCECLDRYDIDGVAATFTEGSLSDP